MAARQDDINLPKVTHPMPAIFVPLDKDLTVPLEGRRDRIDRAKKMIESIDYYTAGVRRGIIHLADIDRKRILAEHQRYQQAYGPAPPVPSMSPAEIDRMIDGMAREPIPNFSYSLNDTQLIPDFRRQMDKPDGEDTLRQLQLLVEDGVANLTGYERVMAAIRKKWTDILEREERLMDEKFGRAPSAPMAGMSRDGVADVDVGVQMDLD